MILKLRTPLEHELRRGRHRPVRGHRPAQASLVDLPEDEAAEQAVRRDLRPDGGAGHRADACRSAITCSASSTTTGPRCRSGSRTTSPAPSRTATSRSTPRSSGPAGSSSRCRSAPRRCTAPPSTASRRTGSTRRDGKPDELDQHFGWFRQLLELQQDTHSPEEFLEFLKVDLYQDEIFVFTPQGDVKRLPKGSTADRLRLPRAHRSRAPLPGRQDQRPDRAAAPRAQERRHGRDPHRADAEAQPGLARARAHGARPAQDQAVDQARRGDGQPRSWASEILAREVKRRRLRCADDAALARGGAGAVAGRRGAGSRSRSAGATWRSAR